MLKSVEYDILRRGSSRLAVMGNTLATHGEDYSLEECGGLIFSDEEIAMIRAVTEDYKVVLRMGSAMLISPKSHPAKTHYAGEAQDIKQELQDIKKYAPEVWVVKSEENNLFVSLLNRAALAGTLDRWIL